MKEIIINGRYLTQPVTGVQRYAHEVVKVFDEFFKQGVIDGNEYKMVLAVPPDLKQVPEFKYIKIKKIGKFTNNLWEQISLPIFSWGKILFNPCNSGPIFGGKKQIITIHDASVFAVPHAYTLLFRLKHQAIIFIMGKIAAKIITDSEFSKSELVKYGNIEETSIEVIHLGSEHIKFNSGPDESSRLPDEIRKPYIFSVGSQSKHKNVNALIAAMEYLEPGEIQLVISGGEFSKVFAEKSEELKPWLTRLGYVSDRELKVLYENALCFVYPSLYEGFGLPPLEAMSCRCPVLVSNAACLPEICGDAALYFDPMNPQEIAKKISLLIENSSERDGLIRKGMAQIQKYNWEKTARMIWEKLSKF